MPEATDSDLGGPRPVSYLRPMGVGELLDAAFRLYRRHLGALFAVGLWAYAPTLLLAYPARTAAYLLQVVVLPLLLGAWVWLSARAAVGDTLSVGRAIGVGFSRYLPIALIGIFYMLVLAAVGLVVGLAGSPLVLAGELGAALLVVWFVVAFAPALGFVAVRLFAWKQVLVVERDWSAFGRSWLLSQGSFWKILGVIVLGWLVTMLPSAVAQFGGLMASGDSDWWTNEDVVPPSSLLVVGSLTSALVQPFSAVLSTLLYYDQRVAQGGLRRRARGRGVRVPREGHRCWAGRGTRPVSVSTSGALQDAGYAQAAEVLRAVAARPEYQPREPSWLERLRDTLLSWLGDALSALFGAEAAESGLAWFLLVLGAVAVGAFVWNRLRAPRIGGRRPAPEPQTVGTSEAHDERRARTADLEPALRAAREGRWDDAFSLVYDATVAALDARGELERADQKTAGDYRRELRGALRASFADLARRVEPVVWGGRPGSDETFTALLDRAEALGAAR